MDIFAFYFFKDVILESFIHVFFQFSAAEYFREKLHLRCLIVFWIRP